MYRIPRDRYWRAIQLNLLHEESVGLVAIYVCVTEPYWHPCDRNTRTPPTPSCVNIACAVITLNKVNTYTPLSTVIKVQKST